MASIVLYRKAADKAPRLGKNQLADSLRQINKQARVNRDTLATFLLDGSFNKLPVVPQTIIDSPFRRESEASGWVIPESEYGRIPNPSQSLAESIRLWIKQRLSAYGVNADSVSVVFINDEEG